MDLARWVFRIAGVYGLLVIAPQYCLEGRIGQDDPPAITHPEYFYGFLGAALAWQVVYLVIAQDPRRYRPMMIVGVLAKSSFGVAAIVLYAQHRVTGTILLFGLIDLALGGLFVAAYLRTGSAEAVRPE